jgi:hypothetical protein
MAASASLRHFFVVEARHTPWRAPLAMAVWGVLAVPGTHALIERLPPRAIRFMELAFRVEGMAAVLLVNDLVAVYMAVFFAGMTGLLSTVVAARETSRLEILLAKPVVARTLLAARVWPVLGTAAAAGLVVAATTAVTIQPYIVPGDQVSVAGAFGGSVFLIAFAVVLLAALVPAFVRMRDGFYAFLVGSAVWIGPVLPSAVLIYRPDLYEGQELLRSIVVLATLVWNDERSAWMGPLALALAPLCCAALVALAGRILERTGVAD